jgi:hypothetical protein|tara:strand:- start:78551 stop:78949 length:399 start_codon:yes stop_codon:yes gene_type:complete
MSIRDILGKGKSLLGFIKDTGKGDLYIALIVILVGITSFGLGRLSLVEENRIPVEIVYPENYEKGASATIGDGGEVGVTSGAVVASRNGTKYHFPWCSGAQRMNESNKVWFNSIEEARAAGYEPAGNCKGLK